MGLSFDPIKGGLFKDVHKQRENNAGAIARHGEYAGGDVNYKLKEKVSPSWREPKVREPRKYRQES